MGRVAIVRAQRRVATCAGCPLAGSNVPMSSPPVAAWAVVGEAPGAREAQKREPFVGPAGRRLRRALERAGLDPDGGAYLNAVSCLPARVPPTPTPDEVRACGGNRVAQLLASEAEVVLACGATALRCWRSDVSISTAWGVPFARGDTVVVPSIHPAVVLRDSGQQWKLDRAVGMLAMIVTGEGLVGVDLLGRRCMACGRDWERRDSDLWPWCHKHGPKVVSAKARAKAMKMARVSANKRRQMEMF